MPGGHPVPARTAVEDRLRAGPGFLVRTAEGSLRPARLNVLENGMLVAYCWLSGVKWPVKRDIETRRPKDKMWRL
jgi:hypothetical protein